MRLWGANPLSKANLQPINQTISIMTGRSSSPIKLYALQHPAKMTLTVVGTDAAARAQATIAGMELELAGAGKPEACIGQFEGHPGAHEDIHATRSRCVIGHQMHGWVLNFAVKQNWP